jgi:hypothetical protein
MATKYQTLSNFLLSPFHGKEDLTRDTELATKYRQYVQSNKIRLYAACQIEDSYYLHMKVPSESQKGSDGQYEYDVVVRFFSDDPEVQAQPHLRSHYVQFYSNSPSFMYTYAYIYKQEDYLIKALYSKIDADYIDVKPEKTNPALKKSYDKSIYFVCKYLTDTQFKYLDKSGVLKSKMVSEDRFFRQISDFKSVKLDQDLLNEERKLSRELGKKKEKKQERKSGKKNSELSTIKSGGIKSITYVAKKTGNKKVLKKVASKSTRKKT